MWELILHHSYRGAPGVIFDQSPGRGSHGVAVNMFDGNFEIDGATLGSGAVRFEVNSRIRVIPKAGWDRLGGIRVEATCNLRPGGSNGILIDGESFTLGLAGRRIVATFARAGGVASVYRSRPVDPTGEIPEGWITVGVIHDGQSTLTFTVNGEPYAVIPLTSREPVAPTSRVVIGNEVADDHAFLGRIDDIKVWRLNPYRVNDEFISRPMDPAVRQCWITWGQQVSDVLRDLRAEDVECPQRILELVGRVVRSSLDDVLAHSPDSPDILRRAAGDYRSGWSSGDMNAVGSALAEFITAMRDRGWDGEQNPDYITLTNDACWQKLISRVPPLDCDPAYTEMIAGLSGV